MNPLKLDPTRTTLLRLAFERDFEARFKSLAAAIYKLVVTEDVFGLGLTANTQWAYEPNSKKLSNFQQWFKDNVNEKLLAKAEEGFWVDDYVKKAYKKGVDKTYTAVRKGLKPQEAQAAKREFDSTFNITAEDKLKLIKSRTFSDLKGVTRAMSNQISNTIIEGLTKGWSPEKIGDAINDRVSKIGLSRARTIARTEIVRAHAEGTLDAMETLGIKDVGVNVEWATAKKPCSLCAQLAGVVMTIEQARGMFPRHPNCLCSPIPSTKSSKSAELKRKLVSSLKQDNNVEWPGQRLLRELRK